MSQHCGCGGCQHDEPAEEKNNPSADKEEECGCGHNHAAEETADGEIKVIEKE